VKSQVYHKTSDILLKYIADNWIRDDIQVGNYLIDKTNEQLEYISVKTSGYENVLIAKIPQSWNNAAHNVEYAEKQVQIYSIIL
jgi:hypothetical protein